MQDYDPQQFESLKWMLDNSGARDWGLDFEDVGQPDRVRRLVLWNCWRVSNIGVCYLMIGLFIDVRAWSSDDD